MPCLQAEDREPDGAEGRAVRPSLCWCMEPEEMSLCPPHSPSHHAQRYRHQPEPPFRLSGCPYDFPFGADVWILCLVFSFQSFLLHKLSYDNRISQDLMSCSPLEERLLLSGAFQSPSKWILWMLSSFHFNSELRTSQMCPPQLETNHLLFLHEIEPGKKTETLPWHRQANWSKWCAHSCKELNDFWNSFTHGILFHSSSLHSS